MTNDEINAARNAREEAEHQARLKDYADQAIRRDQMVKLRQQEVGYQSMNAASAKITAASIERTSRMGLLAEIAAQRVEDRTSATGAANVAKCVAEAFEIVDAVEAELKARIPTPLPQ